MSWHSPGGQTPRWGFRISLFNSLLLSFSIQINLSSWPRGGQAAESPVPTEPPFHRARKHPSSVPGVLHPLPEAGILRNDWTTLDRVTRSKKYRHSGVEEESPRLSDPGATNPHAVRTARVP